MGRAMNNERYIVRVGNTRDMHPDLSKTFAHRVGFKPAATRANLHASRLRESGYDVKVIAVPNQR